MIGAMNRDHKQGERSKEQAITGRFPSGRTRADQKWLRLEVRSGWSAPAPVWVLRRGSVAWRRVRREPLPDQARLPAAGARQRPRHREYRRALSSSVVPTAPICSLISSRFPLHRRHVRNVLGSILAAEATLVRALAYIGSDKRRSVPLYGTVRSRSHFRCK